MPVFVNDSEITDDQVFAEMQYHPSATLEEAQEKAASALAIREMLLQEASRLGITPPETETTQEIRDEYLINQLLEQEVKTPEADETICRRYYDQHQHTFKDTQGNPVLFEYVQSTIEAYLKDISWQIAVKQYLKILIGKSRIAGVRLEGADSPLVQ